MNKFYINLERCTDRQKYFDDTYTRWEATDYKDLDPEHDIFTRMISMHNINPNEHKAKCGCFLSHINLWKHIVEHKLNNVLIVEDDAEQINELPEALMGFTYLGGFFAPKNFKQKQSDPILDAGINCLDGEHKFLMTLAYYIPTWDMAEHILMDIINQKRYRAIDIMLNKISIDRDVLSPAVFIERDLPSMIRQGKVKHSTEDFKWCKLKDVFKIVIPSYQRYDKLKQYTLTYLDTHHTPKKDIFVFIRHDDKDYEKYISLREEGYNVVSTDVKGIGKTHNLITSFFKSGEYIIEIDDDLKQLVNQERKPILSFNHAMRKIVHKMKDENITYSGTYQVANNMFMSQCDEYTYDLRYMLGLIRIRKVCKKIHLETNYSEDFENCILHYIQDGKILKNNWIAGITSNYAKGGCNGDGRDHETEKKDKEFLAEKYPFHCKIFQRKNKRWDLKLKHK